MITYQEAVKKYGTQYKLGLAIKKGEIKKVEPGVYSFGEEGEVGLIATRYPKAVFTMDTAFYFHDLSDVVPEKWHLATKRTAGRISDPSIKQYFESDRFFGIGAEEKEISGCRVRVYDRERMLIELVRRKSSLSFDYYKELIASYRRISEKLDMDKLEDYINRLEGKRNLYRIIQEEFF
jgi:predicted transcriptional regulator of viral defense system